MASQNIVLDTLVWRLVWLRDAGPLSQLGRRLEYLAQVAKPLFQACPSLRQILYTESNGIAAGDGGRRYALLENGELDVQLRAEKDIPKWKDV